MPSAYSQHPCRHRQHSGFTLIELLITIFIIGILISLTLTVVVKVKRAVYGAQTQAQLSAIAGAIQQYYNDYKAYPGPLANGQLGTEYESATTATSASPYYIENVDNTKVTGAQNLVLGLCGGLQMDTTTYATPVVEFLMANVGNGAQSLNTANPRKAQSYFSVKPGDLSTPNTAYNGGAGASYVDNTNDVVAGDKRSPLDAMIPVFLDKYSDPMPILYYRTAVSAPAIVGFNNDSSPAGMQLFATDVSGNQISDSSGNPQYITAQYDLLANYAYTNSLIMCKPSVTYHGLQGIGSGISDPIDVNMSGLYLPSNNGSNGIAYFKDPTLNTAVGVSNTYQGVARQKDGFVLISAGPDRLYGTHDDNIYPGPLQP